jgi:hypothetical protein
MNFIPVFNQEWQLIDNDESGMLLRKLGDGSFSPGVTVDNALRVRIKKDGTATRKGALNRATVDWILWAVQCADAAGNNPPVKNGDVFQDSSGIRWDMWKVDIEANGARFVCHTVQEH